MRALASALALALSLATCLPVLAQSSAGGGGSSGGGTVSVSNFPATQPVSGTVTANQGGTWTFGLSGPIPAGSNAIGSVLSDLRVGGAAVASANPVPVSVPLALPNAYTATPLAASGAYTSALYNSSLLANGANIYPYTFFTCSTYADQAGTLFIESSTDGTNFFPRNGTAGQAVAAGANMDVRVPLTMNVFRCRYVNGATAQTRFFLTGTATRY